MGDLLINHGELVAATRVRLSKAAYDAVAEHIEFQEVLREDGDSHDKLVAHGLAVLWDMYLRLEALDGQA